MDVEDNTALNNDKISEQKFHTKMALSGTASMNSSLYSPDDSGVQCLPTESDLTSSVMSASGMSSDILDMDISPKADDFEKTDLKSDDHLNPFYIDILSNAYNNILDKDNCDELEMENPIQNNMVQSMESDLMNVSLTSYELLDYTSQNATIMIQDNAMNVSISEEVNENLRLNLEGSNIGKIEENIEETIPQEVIEPEKVVEDQIVFRRQRKKKVKSDTPKKRVSFHEDILNSTKVDDIHINHGFITHDDDVSLNFFQKGFLMKSDVVKGRYSWAAEGDTPFYEKLPSDRKTASDIFVHNRKYSSNSSSSGGSVSSSIDEEENSEENLPISPPLNSKPKSSCLKKTPHKKKLDTKIVHEENNVPKRKSETNLLDSNLFGSLKNILTFSTSVPLAERGVPEGQEDITINSYTDGNYSRRRSCTNFSFLNSDGMMVAEEQIPVAQVTKKVGNLNLEIAKSNLKLTKNEGFYPNHHLNQELPANVIICDSNVYEHKGISYSYEYENFQKNFEQPVKKSSTLYQRILQEFNFFKKKALENNFQANEDFEIVEPSTSIKNEDEIKVTIESSTSNAVNRYASSTKLDWSDNDTEYSETSSRHLNSPKRKINRNNHYTVQSFKSSGKYGKLDEEALSLRSGFNEKSSLINRFLKNVTMKKMMDAKFKKNGSHKFHSGLYIKGVNKKLAIKDGLDQELERDILNALNKKNEKNKDSENDFKLINLFRSQLFRNSTEKFIRMYRVRSAYSVKGESRPLFTILTDRTLYISRSASDGSFSNHFVLPYTELDTILLGPNLQTIHFSNRDRDMQCIVSTGCHNVTNDFMTRLEMTMRQGKYKLAAVRYLNIYDLNGLRRAISRQTAVDEDEEYLYYSIVDIKDYITDFDDISLSNPQKKGPLMFKLQTTSSRWETGYFILKEGVLYLLSSASNKAPMKIFPLLNGACQGARRLMNSPRPHTFQLMLDGRALLLAAPDEYVASDWLQALIHAASGNLVNHEQASTQSCSLLITTGHILTVREIFPSLMKSLNNLLEENDEIDGPQTLSCAAIGELTSFRLPSVEQSWCILEFACREVHESSGDWILYFATNSELENFISTLELLWEFNCRHGECFPLSTIPQTDPLNKKCSEVYKSLESSWSSNLVHLQFL